MYYIYTLCFSLFLLALLFFPNLAGAQDITTGLIAHWKFDETSGTTASDSSGNNNTGTLTNGPTWITGKIEGAVSFDGVNDAIIVNSLFSTAQTYTFSFWIKRENVGYVFDSLTGRFVIGFGSNCSIGQLCYYDGAWHALGSVSASQWHHIVLVLDAVGGVGIGYVDNNIFGSAAYTGTNLGGTSVIGNHNSIFNDSTIVFNGLIDDFRIYTRALSVSDIQALYALGSGSPQPPPPSGDTQPPTIPTNLSATPQSSSQINLSWTASTDNVAVAGYRVERCQGSGCTTFAQIATVSGTTYNDTGLTANTTYRYQVRAQDAANNFSNYSSIASATTQSGSGGPSPNPTLSSLAGNTALDLGLYTCTQSDSYPCRQITDYSGFVYDSVRHKMLMFGGGHATTFRDDVDVFDFTTLTWTPAYPPTPCTDMTISNADYVDGRWISTNHPFSRHSYDMLVMADNIDKLLLLPKGDISWLRGGCAPANAPNASSRIALYNSSSKQWTFSQTGTGLWDPAATAEYDPISGKVIIIGQNGQGGGGYFWVYDPVADSIIATGNTPTNISYAKNLIYFPPNQKMYYIANGNLVFEVTIDRSNYANLSVVQLSGITGDVPSLAETGFAYDSANQLIGGGIQNGIFYAFNPLIKTWASRTMQTQPPGGSPGTLAFHALDYDPIDNVFIFIADGTGGRKTWAYKYGGSSPPPPPTGGTALGNLAASMAPGTWAELSTNGMSKTFLEESSSGGGPGPITVYADSGTWDPVTKRFLYLGTAHQTPWKFMMYDDATNTWSAGPKPLACMDTQTGCIGHGYDHNAIDPTAGSLFHRLYFSRDIYRYQSGSWSLFTTIPSSVMPAVGNAGALTYFPEMNGLVYVQGQDGGSGRGAYFYNMTTGQWSRLGGDLLMGPYQNFAEYSPVAKVVIFGGGNGSSDVYKLSAAGIITKMANAPIGLGVFQSLVNVDPVSGNFLVVEQNTRNLYEYNIPTDIWRMVSITPETFLVANTYTVAIQAPISTYGVTMWITYPSAKVYLYKHSTSTPPPTDTTLPTASVTAPSAGTTVINTVTISANASDNVGVTNVEFLVDGVVKGSDASSPYSYSWDTTNGGTHACTGAHTHTLVVRAYDAAGNVGNSSGVIVNMNDPSYCTNPPPAGTVSINFQPSGVPIPSGYQMDDGSTYTSTRGYGWASSLVGSSRDRDANADQRLDTFVFSSALTTWNLDLSNGNYLVSLASGDASYVQGPHRVDVEGIRFVNDQTTTVNNFVTVTDQQVTVADSKLTVVIGGTAGLTTLNYITVKPAGGTPPPSTKFVIGDRVQVSSGPLNVRSTPSTSGTLLGTQATNNLGTVTGGPTAADGYNWWNINYDTGADGWSAEDYLVKYIGAPDTQPPSIPTGLSATAISSSQINLSWNASTDNIGVTGYRIYRGGTQITTVTGTSYSDTVLSPSTTYSYTVAAYDAANNVSLQSSSASATTQAGTPPPPSTGNTVTITNTSGSLQTNRPVSISRPFKQGDIAQYAQASISGSSLLTQTDVKNRWPDGSVKFAIVSFIIPNLPAGGSVTVSFSNQSTGNNTGYLTQTDMLASNYNFDGTIQMTGATTQTVSARTMLQNGHFRYWLQGPIVTAVILEDRTLARTYDKDFGDGSKALHPIYEAWFYPQNNQVDMGYTMENTWSSTTVSKSMRDQIYGLVLTAGNTSPVTKFTQPSFTHTGKSRWHKRYWMGNGPGSIRINHNLTYLTSTKMIANYDTNLTVAESLISSHYTSWFNSDKTLDGGTRGVGNYDFALSPGGQHDWIGLGNTWDILYLFTMDDRMLEKSLGNADLGGRVPFHFREADTLAGNGDYFDVAGTVDTFGRPVSVNARKTVTLADLAQTCTTSADPDLIKTGPITDGGWNGYNMGRHHFPDFAYIPYLMTGRYYYLEEEQYLASYMIGYRPGCIGESWLRQGSAGYFNDGELRGDAWSYRSTLYAAFISPDGSPEKAYYEDKLLNNIAKSEGQHNLPCSTPAKQAHCTWGHDNTMYLTGPSPLGLWDNGNSGNAGPPVVQNGTVKEGQALWMQYFIIEALGAARDMGYRTDGLLQFSATYLFNQLLNPATSPYLSEVYVFPTTLKATNDWIQTWADLRNYVIAPSGWQIGQDVDQGYGFLALAASSFLYPYSAGGYTGQQAWNFMKANKPEQNLFATVSPKQAILPRISTTPPPTPLLGDLNLDGTVNNFDWNIMAGVWFTNDPVADINKDGIVNTADFYFIYTNWNVTG